MGTVGTHALHESQSPPQTGKSQCMFEEAHQAPPPPPGSVAANARCPVSMEAPLCVVTPVPFTDCWMSYWGLPDRAGSPIRGMSSPVWVGTHPAPHSISSWPL